MNNVSSDVERRTDLLEVDTEGSGEAKVEDYRKTISEVKTITGVKAITEANVILAVVR